VCALLAFFALSLAIFVLPQRKERGDERRREGAYSQVTVVEKR
jgi:hypothetical protein